MSTMITPNSAHLEGHPLFPMVVDATTMLSNSGLDNQTTHPLVSFELCQRQSYAGRKEGYPANDSLDDFMARYIEVQQIHKMEFDRIFDRTDDFCNRYANQIVNTTPEQFFYGYGYAEEEKSPYLVPSYRPVPTVNPKVTNPISPVCASMYPHPQTQQQIRPVSMMPPPTYTEEDLSSSSASPPMRGVPKTSMATRPPVGSSTSPQSQKKNNLKKKKKRGSLPKHAVEKLKGWLSDNLAHPYPSEKEKADLMKATGLTLNQVINWFINARRRIVVPMLEAKKRMENKE